MPWAPAQLSVSVRGCFSECCSGDSSQMELGSPPETPGCCDPGPSTSASQGAGNGNGTAVPKDASPVSAGDRPAGAPSPPQPASPSGQPAAAQPPACEGAVQAAESKQGPVGPEADPKLPAPAVRAARPSHSPRKPFNTIIEHLSAAFPGYSRCERAERGGLGFPVSCAHLGPVGS